MSDRLDYIFDEYIRQKVREKESAKPKKRRKARKKPPEPCKTCGGSGHGAVKMERLK